MPAPDEPMRAKEMLERIATAIAEANETAEWDADKECFTWFLEHTRAALAAMREPTPEMIEAMRKIMLEGLGDTDSGIIAVWQAGCDAAIIEDAST